MVNRENDRERSGGISRFHNVGINYSINFPEQKPAITPSFNYTHNLAVREKSKREKSCRYFQKNSKRSKK